MLPAEMGILGLALDPNTFERITQLLDNNADYVDRDVEPVNAAWYGGSHNGGTRLATNAEMARTALDEALSKVAKGLAGHAEALVAYVKTNRDIDERDELYMAQLRVNSDQIKVNDFDNGDQP